MPRTVREWTLTEEIGRGGMGVVYRATHKFLHGDWAVKVIRPELRDAETRNGHKLQRLDDIKLTYESGNKWTKIEIENPVLIDDHYIVVDYFRVDWQSMTPNHPKCGTVPEKAR